jgi:hypothetical protein
MEIAEKVALNTRFLSRNMQDYKVLKSEIEVRKS